MTEIKEHSIAINTSFDPITNTDTSNVSHDKFILFEESKNSDVLCNNSLTQPIEMKRSKSQACMYNNKTLNFSP
jgi:hypothetical protein